MLPILLLLVLGIIQYGLYFWAMQGGADVARDAVRRAAVGELGTCTTFRNALGSQLGSFSTGTPTISRSFDGSDATPGVQVGERVTVNLRFSSLDLNLPFLPLPHDGDVVTAAEARVEHVTTQPETCS